MAQRRKNEKLSRYYFGRILCFEFVHRDESLKRHARSGILELTSDLETIFGVRNEIQA